MREEDEPYDRYTDSAAAGTAMATGERTNNDVISQTPDGEDIPTVLEQAAELGKSTGLATSVQISHATPAVFAAHNEHRDNYDEIAQEMIEESPLNVLMGAGHPDFDNDNQRYPEHYAKDYQYVGGSELWDELREGNAGGDNPWTLVEERAEFQELAEGDTPERVLGLAQVYETLQHNRSGDQQAAPYEVELNENVPTLEEMTRASLNILGDNEDGLFLMVEGGAVDWAGHANSLGRLIEEQSDFNRSVEAAVEWIEENSSWDETLMIVTADHETGYLLGPGSGPDADPIHQPLENNGEGEMPGVEWYSQFHTNELVPLYARGPGASLFEEAATEEDPRRGPYMDIIDHGNSIAEALQPEDTTDGDN
jgi:alkaline phosphatase